MQSLKSRVTVEIDLELEGKSWGYARLPYSVNRSAYGWLPIPIASIRNGDGPSVLLMAGSHGDEYEGQIVLTRLFQSLKTSDLTGQVLILPMANYPAAKAGDRVSPLDGGNLNRLYPGDPEGGPTLAIAHFIETVLMPRVQLVLDLHSGGASLNYIAASTTMTQGDPELDRRSNSLLELFGLPYGLIMPNGGIGSSFDAAKRNQIIRIGTELGGRRWVNPNYRKLCEDGVRRILVAQGVLKNQDLPSVGPVQLLNVEQKGYVFARSAGLFEGAVHLGDHVLAGDLAGHIYLPHEPDKLPVPVHFESDGVVICERADAKSEPGDCLYHLGRPIY